MIKGKSQKLKGKSAETINPAARLALIVYFFLFPFYFLLAAASVSAQDDPNDLAPPPLKAISKDERTRLTGETNVKSRTVLALGLMTARLSAAEKFSSEENFDAMFTELGGFQGILDNTLEFLIRSDNNSDRVLNNFKRFEIGLRGFVPRIEVVRRELPVRYEPYVRSVIRYIRDARSKALEPLFGEPQLRESKRPTSL